MRWSLRCLRLPPWARKHWLELCSSICPLCQDDWEGWNYTTGMPDITSKQQRHSSTKVSSSCEYFQRNVVISFLDHVIMCISDQFSSSAIIATSLVCLVPSILCSNELNLEAAIKKYEADFPSPELFQMELKIWKNRCLLMPPNERPAFNPATTLKDCDQAMFANISVLLQIASTILMMSCECEISASVLQRLNKYMQASMEKSQLSHLARYNRLLWSASPL